MKVSEAMNTLQSISGNIWVRDKALLADKISAVLPDITHAFIEQGRELISLRNEIDGLEMKLLIANNTIERMRTENLRAKHDSIFYQDWTKALERISAALESLK